MNEEIVIECKTFRARIITQAHQTCPSQDKTLNEAKILLELNDAIVRRLRQDNMVGAAHAALREICVESSRHRLS